MGKTWKDDTKRGHRLKPETSKGSGSNSHVNKGHDTKAIRRVYREEKYVWESVEENRT